MNDDEAVKLIIKEIEVYLQFDLMQRAYAKKGIKNALKKIKESAPEVCRLEGNTRQ